MNNKVYRFPDLPPQTFTPVGDRVSILLQKVSETKAGLVLPETSTYRDSTELGVVVGVGPEVKQIKRGDVVLSGGSAPVILMKHEGIELVVLLT